jgi:hypothetical protein
VIQIWTSRNEQGYDFRQHGTADRELADFEGLALVSIFRRPKKGEAAPNATEC